MDIKKDILTINFTPNGIKELRGIVMHSMWGTYQGSIAWFKNPDSKASAHYMVSAEGEITQMVEDKDMAWHAGIIDDVAPDWVRPNPNWYTLGIEIEDKRDPNWQYPQAQREALQWLVPMLMKKYNIPENKLVMHKQLNPSRRSDPVGNFSWQWLLEKAGVSDDMARAIKLIEDYQEAKGYGNLEGTVRALIGSANDLENVKQDLENCTKAKDDLQTALDKSVDDCKKAIDDLNKQWEVKSKQMVTEALDKDGWTWQQHLKEAYRKFLKGK